MGDTQRHEYAHDGAEAGRQNNAGRTGNVVTSTQIGPDAAAAGQPLPKLGEKFTEDQLAERFGVPPGGGIRISKTSSDIILVRQVGYPTGYDDDDDSGEYVYYSGYAESDAGQMTDWRNRILNESGQSGRRVLYFVKDRNDISFHGCVECVGWEPKNNPSRGRVAVFKMIRVDGMMAQTRQREEYSTAVRIVEDETGGYVATVPALPGCISQGETIEEAQENLEEAMSLYLEYFLESRKALPPGLAQVTGVAAIIVQGKSVSAKIETMQGSVPA